MNIITIIYILFCFLSAITSVITSFKFLKINVFNKKQSINHKSTKKKSKANLINKGEKAVVKRIENKPILALPEQSLKNQSSGTEKPSLKPNTQIKKQPFLNKQGYKNVVSVPIEDIKPSRNLKHLKLRENQSYNNLRRTQNSKESNPIC